MLPEEPSGSGTHNSGLKNAGRCVCAVCICVRVCVLSPNTTTQVGGKNTQVELEHTLLHELERVKMLLRSKFMKEQKKCLKVNNICKYFFFYFYSKKENSAFTEREKNRSINCPLFKK